MSAKVASCITKELSVLSEYFALSVLWKWTPSLLVCHSIFSGVGIDEITDFIVALDPQNIGETSKSSTLGTSEIQCEQNSVCVWVCLCVQTNYNQNMT